MTLTMTDRLDYKLSSDKQTLFDFTFPQDHPGLFGGRAKDCEKGFEDSEGKGKASRQELN